MTEKAVDVFAPLFSWNVLDHIILVGFYVAPVEFVGKVIEHVAENRG
jgi:hypothetical protein